MKKKKQTLQIPISKDVKDFFEWFGEVDAKQFIYRSFKRDQIAEIFLSILIENHLIDANTYEWNRKNGNKTELATILSYLNRGGLFAEKLTYKQLEEFSLKAFGYRVSAATIKNSKGKSNILHRLEGL